MNTTLLIFPLFSINQQILVQVPNSIYYDDYDDIITICFLVGPIILKVKTEKGFNGMVVVVPGSN